MSYFGLKLLSMQDPDIHLLTLFLTLTAQLDAALLPLDDDDNEIPCHLSGIQNKFLYRQVFDRTVVIDHDGLFNVVSVLAKAEKQSIIAIHLKITIQ